MQGTTPVQLVFHYIKDIEGVVIASNMIRLDRFRSLICARINDSFSIINHKKNRVVLIVGKRRISCEL